jgi:cell division protein FtsW
VGIGNATTKLIGLPFSATDSIFAVIVEEVGLLGALGLICLYGILLWRGLVIASRAPDLLGTVMAAGLSFWIIIEALINMTMIIGLIPVAGNALPFVSAGGSNLLSTLAAIGILLSISRQSGKKVPADTNERRSYSATVDLRRRDRRRSISRPGRPASHQR